MSTPTTIINRLDQLYAEPAYSWLLTHQGAIRFDLASPAGDVLRSDADHLAVLIGDVGHDTLIGSALAPTLMVGGDGDDTYVMRRTDHQIGDSGGNDTLIVVTELAQEIAPLSNATIALDGATIPPLSGVGPIDLQIISGIDHLTAIVWEGHGASFNLVGNADANRLIGDDFANVLIGNGGDDQLFGNGGDDQLFGGLGADEMSGGIGDDQLVGGTDDDRLYGGAGDDTLEGGAGNDWLEGNAGNDRLMGGEGNDTLNAASGSDRLEGGAGSDLFLVGHQADFVELIGGSGADFFVVNSRAGDMVLHFEDLVLGEDVIDISAWMGTAGPDSTSFVTSEDSVEIAAPGRTLTMVSSVNIMDFLVVQDPFEPVEV